MCSAVVDHQNASWDALAHGDFVHRHGVAPVFVKADGCCLEDEDGYRYLLGEAANGTASLGLDSSILECALRKLDGMAGLPSFCESKLRIQVATRLNRLISERVGQDGKIAFELGGAQAIELAARVAMANRPHGSFVVFEGGYHGRSPFTAGLSASSRYRMHLPAAAAAAVRLPYPDCMQCRFLKEPSTCSTECAAFAERMISDERIGLNAGKERETITALIVEPVLNAGGLVKPNPEYMNRVVRAFKDIGALIIVDEIFCGFHRTGPFWGFEHYDFVPDIVVSSKALTNGTTPFSFVWARSELMDRDHFPPGSHSSTFANSLLGLAAADTVLDRFESWVDVAASVNALEANLLRIVNRAVQETSFVASGSAMGGTARLLLEGRDAGEVIEHARKVGRDRPVAGVHGLILASTGLSQNIVAINPPLTIDEEMLMVLETLLLQTLREI